MSGTQVMQIGNLVTRFMSEYATAVNGGRAFPDDRDGLKPVHRRLLYTMHLMGLKPIRNKKCATIVGQALKIHPHGDAAVYNSLVGMVHDRYPLVQGQGNFGIGAYGTLWEDPAAYRYTEATFTPLGMYAMRDMDVGMLQPAEDGESMEPTVINARLPLLLMNGTEGMGVGARTKIGPHNLREIVRGLRWLVKQRVKWAPNPGAYRAMLRSPGWASKLADRVPGPDYGGGVLLSTKEAVTTLYSTGRGTLRFSCKYHYEVLDEKKGIQGLVITELAPGFNTPKFLKLCADEADKNYIITASDETSLKGGTRIVVAFRNAKPVMDRIVPKLSTAQSYILASVHRPSAEASGDLQEAAPNVYNMATLMDAYLEHHAWVEEQVRLRDRAAHEAELLKLRARVQAFEHLDALMEVLRGDYDDDALLGAIADAIEVSAEQATYIARMPVRNLARTNIDAVKAEIEDRVTAVTRINDELANIWLCVDKSLLEAASLHGDKRGTSLTMPEAELAANTPSTTAMLTWDDEAGIYHLRRPASDPKSRTSLVALFKGKRKLDYTDLLDYADSLHVVYTDGLVRTINLAYVQDGPRKEWFREEASILAVLSDHDERILIGTDKGGVIVVDTQQSVDEYLAGNLSAGESCVSAVGIREGDTVVVYENKPGVTHKARGRRYKWWAKKTKRRGSKPGRPLPHCKHALLQRVPKGFVLAKATGDGYIVTPKSLNSSPGAKKLCEEAYIAIPEEAEGREPNTILVLADGRKKMLPHHLVRSALKRAAERGGKDAIIDILSAKAWASVLAPAFAALSAPDDGDNGDDGDE